jgi:hypothetical protein
MSREPGMNGVVPETKTRLPTLTPCDSGARGLVRLEGLMIWRVEMVASSIDMDMGVPDDLGVLGDLGLDEVPEALS